MMYVLTKFVDYSCILLGVFSTAEKLKKALGEIDANLPDAFEVAANEAAPHDDHVYFCTGDDGEDYEVARIFGDTLLPARKVILYAE